MWVTKCIATKRKLNKHDNVMAWALLWRRNGRDGVSNHQPHDCLFKRLFGRRSYKTSKFRVTGLSVGNSPVTSEFPAQMASNAENVSIWWCHHECFPYHCLLVVKSVDQVMWSFNVLLVLSWADICREYNEQRTIWVQTYKLKQNGYLAISYRYTKNIHLVYILWLSIYYSPIGGVYEPGIFLIVSHFKFMHTTLQGLL